MEGFYNEVRGEMNECLCLILMLFGIINYAQGSIERQVLGTPIPIQKESSTVFTVGLESFLPPSTFFKLEIVVFLSFKLFRFFFFMI